MSKMNIYACGGTGTNVCAEFVNYVQKSAVGFADVECFFIDTSRSNLNPSIPEEKIYLVENQEGAGKDRSAIYNPLADAQTEILHNFKPGDINIVVHSLSGGTGSVIGPIITAELLSRDIPVIVLGIASTPSKKETENSLKTIKSYESISSKLNKPVIMVYKENTPETPRTYIDNEVKTTLVLLSVLFSGQNKELDRSDLVNFLNYPKVTTFPPRLSQLDFFSKTIKVTKGKTFVSFVTLVDNPDTSDVSDIHVEYQAVGIIPPEATKNISIELPIHAVIVAGHYSEVAEKLAAKVGTYVDNRKVVTDKPVNIGDDIANESGLIL